MYGGGSAPSGWLLADGSAVSRATYSALFTALGTTYGAGDGSTTFNVPDLRGRAPIGMGQGSGLTNRSLNDKGGEEAHILTITEMPSHNHSGTFVRCEGCAPQNQSGPGYPTNAGYTTGGSVPSQGGGAAHNNMQPYITLNFIIKT
ncbi:MAG: tail fiber protein [Candidatus Colwellbacteria bacterium]|nr:tail fiber protein [Candidatus Colwellbacteria bacterium]